MNRLPAPGFGVSANFKQLYLFRVDIDGLPPAELQGNSRVDRHAKHEIAQTYKTLVWGLAKQCLARTEAPNLQRYALMMTFRMANANHDVDNLVTGAKYALDALCVPKGKAYSGAGIIAGDSTKYMASCDIRWEIQKKEMTIIEIERVP